MSAEADAIESAVFMIVSVPFGRDGQPTRRVGVRTTQSKGYEADKKMTSRNVFRGTLACELQHAFHSAAGDV